MNNKNLNLESFIKVAEAGSFNKAAEELYITSTALIKQMNLLENELGFRLFTRTHRGLTLTKAGESLYRDAKYLTEYFSEAIKRAKNAEFSDKNTIFVGTSPIMPTQMLMDLWTRIHESHPNLNIRLVPFENTQENAREILRNLGKNIDVVPGFIDKLLMEQRNCQGFKISSEPLCCALSVNHPLAIKDKLKIEDLYGQNLMMMHRGWCESMDRLRNDIETNHPEITIKDFDLYDLGVFNQCEQSKDLLVSIKSWEMIHPLVKVIPVEWSHSIPVGILYSPKPSKAVNEFLTAMQEINL